MPSSISLEASMREPNYQHTLHRVTRASHSLDGVLFVDGFSECGVEFQLDSLLQRPWNTIPNKHLFSWNRGRPGELAAVLDQNDFGLIIFSAFVGGWEYNGVNMSRHKADCDGVEASLKRAVVDRGEWAGLVSAAALNVASQKNNGRNQAKAAP
jgi:hypothetical protein